MGSLDTRSQAKWIWHPQFVDADPVHPGKFVLFHKDFRLSKKPESDCIINVSADTRYRLFVNGTSVAFGPCKSYPAKWYYETIDISPYLQAGYNTISAKVLRFFPGQVGSSSMMRANVPGFLLWGDIDGTPVLTDEQWLCSIDESVHLQPRSEWNFILGPPFLSLDERVDFFQSVLHWQDDEIDDEDWSKAAPSVVPIMMMPALEPWKLYERPIPSLPEIPKTFQGALKCSENSNLQQWNDLITQEKPVTIDAGQTVWMEFESSALTTGFVEFDFIGGHGAEATILYAEAYEKDLGVDKSPFPKSRSKGNRRDFQNGRLYGTEDHVTLAGGRTKKVRYEPFWFRTFRFIRLTIHCKKTPTIVSRIAFRETVYPLEITTEISLPAELEKPWDICINTLQKCMHETYEDCPFYEQNQFAMDGRLQLLFTYQLSRDDRLARKTINEFYASRRKDGLLETNYPVSFRAINIPQFSLFWILMIYDHMMYFGDQILVKRYAGTVDVIHDYFDNLLNEDGLVGAFDEECWAFIDWVKEWQGKKGIRDMAVPPVYKRSGVAAYNSLLFSWVLQHAAKLNQFINRNDTAAEYLVKSAKLNEAVQKHCWNGQFFLDGPGAPDTEICEHTQIFAILANAVIGDEAKSLMERTMTHESLPRCSYAMKHYVFRALEKTGLYETYFQRMLQPWLQMVQDNCTTCPEDDVSFRSDCHGWSAGLIYEFVAVLYGVQPAKEGFGDVKLEPKRDLLKGVDGRLSYKLPTSRIDVEWAGDGEVEFEVVEDANVMGRRKSIR